MRVRYTTGFAGHGFTIEPGDVRDVSEADAKRLIERQCAEPVDPDDGGTVDDDGGEAEDGDETADGGDGAELETAALEPGTGKRKRKRKAE